MDSVASTFLSSYRRECTPPHFLLKTGSSYMHPWGQWPGVYVVSNIL